jgi:hypothetical protein
MRTFAVLAAATVAGTLAVTSASAASAVSAHRISAREKDTVKILNGGKDGLAPGDRIALTAVFRDSGGAKIGDGGGDCVVLSGTSEKNAVVQCTQVNRFGASQLVTTGIYDFAAAGMQHWSITGGTGKFSNAHGVVDFVTVTPDTFDDVFRFTT